MCYRLDLSLSKNVEFCDEKQLEFLKKYLKNSIFYGRMNIIKKEVRLCNNLKLFMQASAWVGSATEKPKTSNAD